MMGEKRRRTRTATATVEASTRTRVSARRRSVKARHPVRRAMAKVTGLQGHPGHQGSAPERDRPPTWFLELRDKLYRRGSHLAHLLADLAVRLAQKRATRLVVQEPK